MLKNSSIEINGKSLHVETGRIAKQANGSAVVTHGETVVLVTAVSTDQIREGIDFLPLTVEYQEMSYAGGRIPGNFFRRDMGRPGESETLTSRLIDRPLRPLFPDNYYYETQVIATVLSTDKENEADVLAMLGASTALEISDIPFAGPIAGVRVGRVDGRFIANPTLSQQVESDINLIVAFRTEARAGSETHPPLPLSWQKYAQKWCRHPILRGKDPTQPILFLPFPGWLPVCQSC